MTPTTKKSRKIKKNPSKGTDTISIKIPHKDIHIGRPFFYETPEDMQIVIDKYFEIECADEIILDHDSKTLVDTKGRPVIHYNPPTLSGLALYLGFVDRQSLYDYRDRKCEKKEDESEEHCEGRIAIVKELSCTIKRAIARIEEYAEKQLHVGNSTGAIFWLKNKGWTDQSKIELTGKNGRDLIPASVIEDRINEYLEE